MANIWVLGFKSYNPTALRNVGFTFIQRGFTHVPKGHTGEDDNMAEKTTSIFTRKTNPASRGLIQMFSSGPKKPGIDNGSPPQHNEKPGSKGAGKPTKDTGSDPKNLHEEPEAKNN